MTFNGHLFRIKGPKRICNHCNLQTLWTIFETPLVVFSAFKTFKALILDANTYVNNWTTNESKISIQYVLSSFSVFLYWACSIFSASKMRNITIIQMNRIPLCYGTSSQTRSQSNSIKTLTLDNIALLYHVTYMAFTWLHSNVFKASSFLLLKKYLRIVCKVVYGLLKNWRRYKI